MAINSQVTALMPQITQAADANNIDPNLLAALVQQESGGNPNAVSSAGAQGLTQLMPGTAASVGVTDPFNITQSLDGGAQYLAQMLSQFGGDVSLALAAYNAGPGAVSAAGGIPNNGQTPNYVSSVLSNYMSLSPPSDFPVVLIRPSRTEPMKLAG
jgi:soluble lytic murein transglycosylase-like protein